jgi:hypothetical protein
VDNSANVTISIAPDTTANYAVDTARATVAYANVNPDIPVPLVNVHSARICVCRRMGRSAMAMAIASVASAIVTQMRMALVIPAHSATSARPVLRNAWNTSRA